MQAKSRGDLKLNWAISFILFPKTETPQSKSPILNKQNNKVPTINQAQRADASKLEWGFEIELGDWPHSITQNWNAAKQIPNSQHKKH